MQATETILSVIRDHPKLITGEPVTGKLVRRVREGADGKGPVLRAPHRRPTSLCGSPGVRFPRATRPAGRMTEPRFSALTGCAHRRGRREMAGRQRLHRKQHDDANQETTPP